MLNITLNEMIWLSYGSQIFLNKIYTSGPKCVTCQMALNQCFARPLKITKAFLTLSFSATSAQKKINFKKRFEIEYSISFLQD